MPSPIPLPTAIKAAAGNPGKRPLNALEPRPQAGEPEMPPDLDGAEADAWREMVPILMQMQVLSVADGTALGSMCRLEVRLRKAREELNATLRRAEATGKLGFMLGGDKGIARANPLVTVVCALEDEQLRWLREFGLTPSSRTKIATSKEAGNSDIEDALCA